MNHWTAAALTAWGIGLGLSLAFFVGKGRNDLKTYLADRARQEYVDAQFAALTAPLEDEVQP